MDERFWKKRKTCSAFFPREIGILQPFTKIDIKILSTEVLNTLIYIGCVVGNVGLRKTKQI